jgi:hypothetical protein
MQLVADGRNKNGKGGGVSAEIGRNTLKLSYLFRS